MEEPVIVVEGKEGRSFSVTSVSSGDHSGSSDVVKKIPNNTPPPKVPLTVDPGLELFFIDTVTELCITDALIMLS